MRAIGVSGKKPVKGLGGKKSRLIVTPFRGNVNLVSKTEGYALKPAQFEWVDQMASGDTAFFKALGKRMAQLRNDRSMSQQELADVLGIAQQTLGNYETGRSRLPASLLPALTDVFGVSLEMLLGQGERTTRNGKRGPTPKLQQQLEQVSRLPKAKQMAIAQVLDSMLANAP
jgi:transcriptional regulator with XRE-family HTH domain